MNRQEASQSGSNNIIVQATGENIQVQVGVPHLNLIAVGARLRNQPRREIDVLNPAYQAVPLVGRERDLRFLHDWLSAEARIAVTAMVGHGGSGKSRLALELLQQLPPAWQGGFLTSEEADRFLGQRNLSDWSWQRPTLVVVDYAASLARTLFRWFAELADHSVPDHSLRILLLERHADARSGWYYDLADGSWHGQAVRDLISPFEPWRLTPLNEASQRRRVLESGLQTALALTPAGKPIQKLPQPGEDPWFDKRLEADQWADPLILLMAALCAPSKGLNAALKLSRPDLALQLALRERDQIRKCTDEAAEGKLLAHLYACVTLCGGLDRSEAIEVAENEFTAMHRQYPGGAGQAVADLVRHLGANDSLPPLLPNLLGEALLPVTFAEEGPAVTVRLARVHAERVASRLVGSVQDFGSAGERWPVEWLRGLIEAGRSKPLLMLAIIDSLPENTVILRELAVEVTQFVVEKVVSNSPEIEVLLARLWNGLSVRQSAVGLHDAALASASEAVRRQSALVELDRETHLASLGDSLNTQAVTQLRMGQFSNGLSSMRECIRIRRELAGSGRREYLRALAKSLNNQSNLQGGANQFAEGLASISEAVEIHRAIAADDPSELSRHNLAGSLNNQSNWQHKTRKPTEALASAVECIRIRRAIAEASPDEYLPDFAGSLLTLFNAQIASGRRAEALASACEALAINRGLAQSNPDAFLHALAESLGAHAGAHRSLKQHAEALTSIVEAVQIKRILSNKSPSAFLPSLALSLWQQAVVQTEAGQPKEALASIDEAVRHYRMLAEANPEAFLPDLAGSLNIQANWLVQTGQHAKALPPVEEALRICRAQAGSKRDVFLPALATSLSIFGNCLEGTGKLHEGRAAAEESLRVLAPLFLNHPGAYDGLGAATIRNYLSRCQRLGSGPDSKLLASLYPLVRMSRSIPMTDIGLLAQQAVTVLAPLLPLAAANAATQMAQGFFKQPGARLFDWLASKLKGTPAAATFDRAVAEPENQRRLEALRLEIEDIADKDTGFREELAGILKEIASATGAVTSTQTLNQTGDNNKGAVAGGNDITIEIG